ncbi:MAG: EamA family transporter [Firmicutes bacterium]|nr:EamA family transporter [Bacillota bacterium]
MISAVTAGFVSITVKAGMKDVDAGLGTLLRTGVVLVFTLLIAALAGADSHDASGLALKDWLFITASGLCTGLSWFFYINALKTAQIHKIVAVDKMSVVLTMILAIVIFNEPFGILTVVSMVLMTAGTLLMVQKTKAAPVDADLHFHPAPAGAPLKREIIAAHAAEPPEIQLREIKRKKFWILYAILSLIFASLTSILAKIGMQDVNSHLGTFLRTCVVAVASLIWVLSTRKLPDIKNLTRRNWLFITVSGMLTGVSWLCYYAALQTGVVSVIAPLDRLSVPVAVIFSLILFKEKLSPRALTGLGVLTVGIILILF